MEQRSDVFSFDKRYTSLNLTVSVEELIDSYLFEVVPNKHVFVVTYACTLNGQFNPSISHEHKSVGLFNPEALPSNLPIGYRSSIDAWNAGRPPSMLCFD